MTSITVGIGRRWNDSTSNLDYRIDGRGNGSCMTRVRRWVRAIVCLAGSFPTALAWGSWVRTRIYWRVLDGDN